MRKIKVVVAGAALLLASAAFGQQPTKPVAIDYSKPAHWLCRPDVKPNACDVDLTTTIVDADGKTSVEGFQANPAAQIDCFYVYPTVSLDPTTVSDMTPGAEERSVVRQQFARFASQCRVFAPLYRQLTLSGLRAVMAGQGGTPDMQLGYADVLAAWNYYLQHDNQKRGVVLIGHSQGSAMLTQLIAEEIDGKQAQGRLVSALLLGWNVAVPRDRDMGGSFKNIPACHASTQIECVLAYVSFRSDSPPPVNSLFGKVSGDNMRALCVNPAMPGGRSTVHSYYNATTRGDAGPWVTGANAASITTPYVSVPGLVSVECVDDNNGSYLSVKVNADPKDPRTDTLVGDVLTNGVVQKNWGLHLIDVDTTIGNLVAFVGEQAKAYVTAREAALQDCKCENKE
ncbi:MAG TPA: DUF3089 domain-containing protein [Steroidobacteraceae bacterium]|nr:DUF3089 domain-containing protein [Steroidobacteraceae bacterium]